MTDPTLILYYFDMIGIASCAAAGTIQAYRHDLDLLGTLLIATVSSIGGGTVRDVLLDRNPIFWIADSRYLILIICTSLFVQIFFTYFQRIKRILRITDAMGLAVFNIIGIEAALTFNANPMIAIFMGVITSTFGGIVRDITCNEVPLVLKKEIYILACIFGGMSYFLLTSLNVPQSFVYIVSGSVVFTVRMISVYYNWDLPKPSKQVEN